jgi:hypothetical protein
VAFVFQQAEVIPTISEHARGASLLMANTIRENTVLVGFFNFNQCIIEKRWKI